MDKKIFEQTLSKDLVDSIMKRSEDWKKSEFGLFRHSDNVELWIKYNGVEIKQPQEYVFTFKEYENKLLKVAKTLNNKLLIKKDNANYNLILDSLTYHPEEWSPSLWGMEIKYNKVYIELNLSSIYAENFEVQRPLKLKISNKKYKKHLHKVATKVLSDQLEKVKDKKMEGNMKKLYKELNLNTRKNKLERLREISKDNIVVENYDIIENDKKEKIVIKKTQFQKIIDWFKV
jgi:hypothetical protein